MCRIRHALESGDSPGKAARLGRHWSRFLRATSSMVNFKSLQSAQSLTRNRLDIMGATTGSRMPLLSSAEVRAALNKFRTPRGREWGFDVFYCPIDLFEYIADITMLYKLQPKSKALGEDVLAKAVQLGNCVKCWRFSSHISGPRAHAVEAWRSGVLVYLIRLFHLPKATFDASSLIKSIFDHAMTIPSGTSWCFSLLWPLFQAGLSLNHDDYERKTWLRHELNSHFQALGCSHPNRALCALEQAWTKRGDRDYNSITLGMQYQRLMLM